MRVVEDDGTDELGAPVLSRIFFDMGQDSFDMGRDEKRTG